jgi:hypothetical protein
MWSRYLRIMIGLLDCWNSRLHRSRGLFTEGLWERMRLVVFGGDYVRVLSWLSTVLLRIPARNLPEDRRMEAISCPPRWCPFERRSWGPPSTVSYSLQLLVGLRFIFSSPCRLITTAERRLDVDRIKNHHFFYGVDWDTIRHIDAPFVPHLRSITDTSYFPTEELAQVPDSATERDSNATAKDIVFLGFVIFPD